MLIASLSDRRASARSVNTLAASSSSKPRMTSTMAVVTLRRSRGSGWFTVLRSGSSGACTRGARRMARISATITAANTSVQINRNTRHRSTMWPALHDGLEQAGRVAAVAPLAVHQRRPDAAAAVRVAAGAVVPAEQALALIHRIRVVVVHADVLGRRLDVAGQGQARLVEALAH